MKTIRILTEPPAGLTKYLEDDGDRVLWNRFHNYDGSTAFNELRDALVRLQHGLCGYCEISLLVSIDCQIEHVIPRSHPDLGSDNAFNPANLIACCEGGTREKTFGSDALQADTDRHLPPTTENTSCGAKKKDKTAPDFVDPRDLPAYPSLFRVRRNGEIVADPGACECAGVPVKNVERTVAFLGLNVPRLRRARERYFAALDENENGYLDSSDAIQNEARQVLLPGGDCYLLKFFTTARSYFGQLGERLLAEQPQAWI